MYRVNRFPENPIIHPKSADRIGSNINGPSCIRVPDWVPHPLGRYYLYFAHHEGTTIRMAYADGLHGPWKIHEGGVLTLADTACNGHIASPDVHVCELQRTVRMYFHGGTGCGQRSFLATSPDGLHFQAQPDVLGPFYFRVFRHENAWYAVAKRTDASGGGQLLRSPDGMRQFEPGPTILPRQRHAAVLKQGTRLHIFFSRGEDCPERILVSVMRLQGDWRTWQAAEPVDVLRPERAEEGALLPMVPSLFGSAHEPVHQVRDPAVYQEGHRLFLFYSGAGETNICGAELTIDSSISRGEDDATP